jgi:hypothetical protein
LTKLFALILLLIFISGNAINIYIDFTQLNKLNICCTDIEDDKEENESKNELEKDNDNSIDKLTFYKSSSLIKTLSFLQNFYIDYSHILPKPYIAKKIYPPNFTLKIILSCCCGNI